MTIIIDEITWMIDKFIEPLPKPIKFGLFLVFLLILGVFITFMFHVFGVHCDSEGTVVRTDPFDIYSNVRIAFTDANAYFNESSYAPPPISIEIPVVEPLTDVSCSIRVCHLPTDDPDVWIYANDHACDNLTKRYIFLSKSAEFSRCVICQGDTNYTLITGSLSFITSLTGYYCFGDAHPIPDDDKNWIQDWVCKPSQRCVPPEHYYYESDTGTYDCLEESYCGQNRSIEDIPHEIDVLLVDANAEVMYKSEKKDYRKLVYFECDKENKLRFTFFGIPILDYRTWVLLAVIVVMFLFYHKIKNK